MGGARLLVVDGDGRIVESHLYYLRRTLDRSGPALIHAVRSVGYALRMPWAGLR